VLYAVYVGAGGEDQEFVADVSAGEVVRGAWCVRPGEG